MNKDKKIYFIGIAGIGMSGLAIIAKEKGYNVYGSDIAENYITEKLKKYGIKVFKGHKPENIKNDIDLVVISSAIDDKNPELVKASSLKIPIVKRAKFLAILSEKSKTIAVSGTHGKTTTTGMLASIFEVSNLNYTAVIGGISKHLKENARMKGEEYFVIEADESDGSFMYYNPFVIITTNIDNDHLDFYKNIKNIKNIFISFINKIPVYGRAVLCGDDNNISDILEFIKSPYYSYGFKNTNNWQIKNIINDNTGMIFDVYYKSKKEDRIKTKVFGDHNALNSLAAYVVARYLGIDKYKIKEGLYKFEGMKRRMDFIGNINDTLFYDDYAHHPREIKATLSAIRSFYPERRIVVIFQPHRYTRTKFLLKEFPPSFTNANEVYITQIYGAGEKPIKNINSEILIHQMIKYGINAKKFDDIYDFIKKIKPKDIVISMGAGDIYKLINEIKLKYELISG